MQVLEQYLNFIPVNNIHCCIIGSTGWLAASIYFAIYCSSWNMEYIKTSLYILVNSNYSFSKMTRLFNKYAI